MTDNTPIESTDYVLVRLIGRTKFDVYAIIDALVSNRTKDHFHFADRPSLLSQGFMYNKLKPYETYYINGMRRVNVPIYVHSLFYHTLQELITYGTTEDGQWYDNEWHKTINNEPYNGICNTVFYDEFLFLASHNLIQFEDFEPLTHEKIWSNYDAYVAKEESKEEFPELVLASDIYTLKKEFRKKCLQCHPDLVGQESNEKMRRLILLYGVLKKSMSVVK